MDDHANAMFHMRVRLSKKSAEIQSFFGKVSNLLVGVAWSVGSVDKYKQIALYDIQFILS